MLPTEGLSDTDLHKASREELKGRWLILTDLYIEFQGAAGAYFFFAVVIGAGTAYGVYTERLEALGATIGAVLTVSCTTIAIYSYIWFMWVRKRKRLVSRLFFGWTDES